MSKNKRKLLTIPIEIYQREFDLALYMALVATEKGFQVLLGGQIEKVFKKTKNGVYYHKDHANWSKKHYQSAIKRGMKTCALDVEGLIYSTPKTYLNIRANKWILDNIDLVFIWGENQRKLIESQSQIQENKVVVGSPKFDICELEKRNNKKTNSQLYARKILINTRFASTNGFSKDNNIENLKNLGVLKTEEDIIEYNKSMKSEMLIFNEFLSFLEISAVNKDFLITIRPHPAENPQLYEDITSKFKNVIIDKDSDLRLQILSHDCVIHDGCTTAIEARALNKPVFGLRPSNLENAYIDYANQYSLNFTSAEDLYKYLLDTNIEDFNMPNIDKLALKSIDNWLGINGNATHKIVEQIDLLDIPLQDIVKFSWYSNFNIKTLFFKLSKRNSLFYKTASLILGEKFERFYNGRLLLDNKFGEIDLKEVRSRILYYNKLDEENTTSLKDLSIVQSSEKLLLLYKNQ